MQQPVLPERELSEFLDDVFPQVRGQFVVEELSSMRSRMRMPIAERHLRPGGTVSGPAMFALADVAFYAATLGMIGREPLTVTTNLNINFMRKPALADMIAEARILKLGRTLSVGDVTLWSDGKPDPVAHATCTYAIPPKSTG
ncbi:MAG: PaaI family thioesterase [Neomegalonema sp.]